MGLRRLIKSRIRAHLHDEIISSNNNAEEQPLSSTITKDDDHHHPSILFRENPNLLQVTREDVDKCYSFANRVGMKWADELKRQGCLEYSDIVLQLVNNRGQYLEPSSTITGSNSTDEQQNNDNNHEQTVNDNHDDEANHGNKKFSTAYAALHSLRRYEPDCDGSGKPYEHLRPIRQEDNDKSARKIIQQIDEMANNGQTLWHYGWDAIEEAVKRNKERIDYSRANQDEKEVQEGMTKSKGTKRRVHFEGDIGEQADDVGEVLKKRRYDESDAEHSAAVSGTVNKPDETIHGRGRPPSSIGDTVYSWESILQSMSSQERRNLIMSSIHPPYPFEETIVDDGSEVNQATAAKEECGVNVVGALKEVGLTHLFEQTRHLPKEETNDGEERNQSNSNGLEESFLGASETRASFKSQQLDRMKKKAMRKAEKERLGRRAPVMGEKNADYYGFGTAVGKVRLTEEEDQSLSTNTKREAPTGTVLSLQIHDEPERQRWLEFDLGECFLEEVEEDSNQSEGTSSVQEKTKRFLAFRSLEIAIMD